MKKENNSFINTQMLIGFAIGVTVPVFGYVIVEFIFEQLTNAGVMNELGSSLSVVKRLRTLAVLAIATNLIPFQLLRGRREFEKMRGILLATFIYAIVWVIYFWDSILM